MYATTHTYMSREKYKDAQNSTREITCQPDFMRGFEFRARNYLAYTTSVFDYYEKFSKDLIGYEPKQVLLLHANWLEAEHIDELLDLLRKRGYEFVTLQ